ncbi:MAG: hypothetical protein KKA60_11895 [Proteobacteria bacterium]|nr:hypothetical protein [Pseudomonadota bacterium]
MEDFLGILLISQSWQAGQRLFFFMDQPPIYFFGLVARACFVPPGARDRAGRVWF